MSKVDPYLRFPSGRTIKNVKNDAKRFAKTADISHTSALDTLARVNGLDMCWSAAMRKLSRSQRSERDSSFDADERPRIHHVGVGAMFRADPEPSESRDGIEGRVRPHDRTRRRRLKHALQLFREGHLSKVAISEICGIPITELQVHICRMNYIESTPSDRRRSGTYPTVSVRRSRYQREHEPE